MPLRCSNLTLHYDGRPAVTDATFTVEDGEYISIVGENGAGKSTLIKGLLGLMPPVSGEVLWEGLDRSEIGFLPQHTEIQSDFPATVREVVSSGCISGMKRRFFYSASDKERVRQAAELLHLEPLMKKSIRELSIGQRQRVLFARSLCAARRFLILDEPAAGLDPIVTADIYSILKQLNQKQGMTVLMVSHDLEAALQNSTLILHIDLTIRFYGSPSEYLHTDAYRRFAGGGERHA